MFAPCSLSVPFSPFSAADRTFLIYTLPDNARLHAAWYLVLLHLAAVLAAACRPPLAARRPSPTARVAATTSMRPCLPGSHCAPTSTGCPSSNLALSTLGASRSRLGKGRLLDSQGRAHRHWRDAGYVLSIFQTSAILAYSLSSFPDLEGSSKVT